MKKANNTLYFNFGEIIKSLFESTGEQMFPEYNYHNNENSYSMILWNYVKLSDRLFKIINFTNDPNVIDIPITLYPNIIGVYEGDLYLKDYVANLLDYISWEYKDYVMVSIKKDDYVNSKSSVPTDFGTKYYSYNLWCLLKDKLLDILLYMNNTYERYSTLLGFYASKKADLMNALSSSYSDVGAQTTKGTNENKSNDTPQEPYDDDYSDSNYSTSTSKGSSEATTRTNLTHTSTDERENLMTRLNEIERKYSNVMANWVAEFGKFFTSPLNIMDYEDYTGE